MQHCLSHNHARCQGDKGGGPHPHIWDRPARERKIKPKTGQHGREGGRLSTFSGRAKRNVSPLWDQAFGNASYKQEDMWIRKPGGGGGGGWEAARVAMLLIRQLHGKLALCLPRAPSTFPLLCKSEESCLDRGARRRLGSETGRRSHL